MLNKLANLNTEPIRYKGTPAAITDLIGGNIDFTFADYGNAASQAQAGRVRALAVTSAERNSLLPDLPAVAEVAQQYRVTPWLAVFGPQGMDPSITTTLNDAINQALQAPALRDRLLAQGLLPMQMEPEQLKKFVKDEVENWKTLVKDANIEPQ